MSVRVLPSGESALLAECDDLAGVLALHDALAASAPMGLVELVPAVRTVLVVVDPARLPLESAASWIRRAAATPTRAASSVAHTADAVVLPTTYDGPDLAELAATLGLTIDDLVARHIAARWRVAFIGFAPGFAYLASDDWMVDVPRRSSPRTRVPAGSVGLAGRFTGAYPRESPGGWQLIGTTSVELWRADATPPALLAPGTRVRFEAVGR